MTMNINSIPNIQDRRIYKYCAVPAAVEKKGKDEEM